MNIDEFLTPISESAPCGEDLSFSTEFDAITEMRREDDPTLNQGEWVTALKSADWVAARARCGELLTTRSKDLRLAMWWAEAAGLTEGYAGLQQGITLCARLCEQYWDGLYPIDEDGDMEQRVGNIGWFVSRLVTLSAMAPVTRGRTGAYSLQQMHAARSLQGVLERTPEKAGQVTSETLTMDKFGRALRETPKEDLRQTLAAVQTCIDALQAWQAVVDAKLGAEGPSFVPAREALGSALHEVQRLAREMGALAGTPAVETVASAARAEGDVSVASAGGPLRSRDQALAQLKEVAAFFRATEPHSPVAYLADKAVHWGDMPLHLWLRAVVKDGPALAHLEELLGLESASPDNPASS